MDSLADFPATICRVKTLADGGIRIEFDLPETESSILSIAHEIKRSDRYLRVVIYDDKQFRDALIAIKEQ